MGIIGCIRLFILLKIKQKSMKNMNYFMASVSSRGSPDRALMVLVWHVLPFVGKAYKPYPIRLFIALLLLSALLKVLWDKASNWSASPLLSRIEQFIFFIFLFYLAVSLKCNLF